MELRELLEFIDLENERLIKRFGKNFSEQREMILARTVKLAEEFGELCSEVLTSSGYQRQERLDKYDKNNLSDEFADVIITTLLLAKLMDVDIREALANKIEKINKRYE